MIASLPRPLLFSRDLESCKRRPGSSVGWPLKTIVDKMFVATVVAKIVADAAVLFGLCDASMTVERQWLGVVGILSERAGGVESRTISGRIGGSAVEWSKRWVPR